MGNKYYFLVLVLLVGILVAIYFIFDFGVKYYFIAGGIVLYYLWMKDEFSGSNWIKRRAPKAKPIPYVSCSERQATTRQLIMQFDRKSEITDIDSFEKVKCGNDLYHFIDLCLYRGNSKYMELYDYLISLWKVSENYKDESVLDYSMMAKMLQEAFTPQSVNINWEDEIKKPYKTAITTTPNTPEYFKEVYSYDYFSRYIKNMIIDLLRLRQERYSCMHWENIILVTFLEAALQDVSSLYDKDEKLDWGDMSSFLHSGQYTE